MQRRAGRRSTGVGGVAAVCAFLGWFAALALGRMPLGLRDLGAYGLGYGAQANAYFLLLTDRYPNSDPDALGPAWSLPAHPLRLELDDDGRRSRLTVFFRLAARAPALRLAGALDRRGVPGRDRELVRRARARPLRRAAAPLPRRLRALLRARRRVHHSWSPIRSRASSARRAIPVDISIGPPEPQNRWITLFRIFLAIPALLVSGALSVRALRRRPSSAGSPRSSPAGCRPASQPRRGRDPLPRADERVLVRPHRPLSVREPGAPAAAGARAGAGAFEPELSGAPI